MAGENRKMGDVNRERNLNHGNREKEITSMIRIKVRGKPSIALVDSGACYSALDHRLLNQFKLQKTPLVDEPTRMFNANGGEIKILGTVHLNLDIGGQPLEQKCLVTDGLMSSIILGLDFIKSHNIVIDIPRGVIKLTSQKGEFSEPLLSKMDFVARAESVVSLILKPGFESRVPVEIIKERDVHEGTTEQWELHQISKPNVGLEVIKVPGTREIIVRNHSDKPILINRNTPIAQYIKTITLKRTDREEEVAETEHPEMESCKLQEIRSTSEPKDKGVADTKEELKTKLEKVKAKTPKERTIEEVGLSINKDNRVIGDLTEFRKVMKGNIDLFALDNSELGTCKWLKAKFRLKNPHNTKPIKGKIFNHSREAQEEIDRQIEQLLKDGHIVRSCSPYTAATLLVRKKTGEQRLVQDFREVNKIIEDDFYPPPTFSEILQKVGRARPQIFSSVDLRSAYSQILIEDGISQDLCSFITANGTFSFKRMSFGVKTSPAIFQMVMNKLLSYSRLLQTNAVAFLDDLLIFTRTLEEHTRVMKDLFGALREAGLKLHPSKSEFLKGEVKYLGHHFSAEGIRADEGKLKAILEFPRPKKKKDLKSFLGIVQFYKSYHRDLTKKISPLLELLKKDVKFVWSQKQEDAFQEVRNGLKDLPVLGYADESKDAGKYIITSDASDRAVACTLSQVQDGEEKLLCCFGRSLRPNERVWSSQEKEGIGLMMALLKWRHLLVSNAGLEIRSDNMSVKFLERIKTSTQPRLARWSIAMNEILSKATWTHIKGKTNVICDALSRRDYEQTEPTPEEEDLLYDDLTFATLLARIGTDPSFHTQVIGEELIEAGEEVDVGEDLKEYHKMLKWVQLNGVIEEDEEVLNEYRKQIDQEENKELQESEVTILYDDEYRGKEYFTEESIRVIRSHIENIAENLIQTKDEQESKMEGERITGVQISGENPKKFNKLQRECSELGPLIKYLEEGELDGSPKEIRKVIAQSNFHIINTEGTLCMINPTIGKEEEIHKVVPISLRKEVMQGYHSFGHLGMSRLYETIVRAGYKWPRMIGDIRNYVLGCTACAIGKRGQNTPKTELKPLEYPEGPGVVWQCDLMGPYHKSEKGHVAILSIIDRFSGYLWLYPLKDTTSATIARKLFKTMSQAGIPRIIISDNAASLISHTMQALMDRLGIKAVHIAPYHSSSNSKIERCHRVIGDNLRTLLVGKDVKKWDEVLPEILMGIRSAVSTVAKISPFELWTGRPMILPIERKLQDQSSSPLKELTSEEVKQYVTELNDKITTVFKTHKLKMEEYQQQMKENYDKKIRKQHHYKIGEKVFLKDNVGQVGQSRKLLPEYLNVEYEIVEMDSHNVKLKDTATGKILQAKIHKDRIKPCFSQESNTGQVLENEDKDRGGRDATAPNVQSSPRPPDQMKPPNAEGATVSKERESTSSEQQDGFTREYKIVEQKNSGERSRFRLQWKDLEGRHRSEWQNIDEVDRNLLQKWRLRHGLSGRVLARYKRARK